MTNYPYPANFLEPMPAWPINESVKAWVDVPTKAELAEESTEEAYVWTVVRSALKFFRITEENANHLLSYVNPKNTKPLNHEDKPKQAADGLTDRAKQLLNALQNSTSVYFNYTGAYPCTNLSDWEGTGSLDGFGWNVLACNQLAMPISFNDSSMFIPVTFDYDSYTKSC